MISRISKCWLARGVEEGPTTADASLSSSNVANQTNQSDGAYSMRIVVMVIDPYAKMDDDLDPAPSSTLCAGSPQPHQKQAKEDKFFDAQLGLDSRSNGGGDSIRELANGKDDSEDEDDDDCAFTDAISNDADGDADADGELHMSPPPKPALSQAVAADIATAATRRSAPSSFPAPHTVREVEVVLRRFKSCLAEHSSVCLASVQQHDTISPTPPNPIPSTSTGLLSPAALDVLEGNLLSLMTTLPSLSPLIECLTMVEYVELTGQTSGGDGSNGDVAALTTRNLVIFSASFHKKALQLLEQQIQIIKADLSSGREVVENMYSCAPFIEDLEREITFRRSLLGGYSLFKDRDKDKECISSSASSSSSSSSMTQDSQERLSALCKLSTSRAEAMCWLQSAPKRCVSPTHGDLSPKATNSSSISFTLYRALHNTSGNDSNEMSASDNFRGANMLARERDDACRPTISHTLSQILGTTSTTVCDVTILGPPTLKFAALLRSHGTGTVAAATAVSVSLPSSVRSAVVQFLAAPLVGVDSDVFGLQGFTSALELSGLTCPSMLLLMLPCVVARLEGSTLEDLTSMLLRDVSLSPFQRYVSISVILPYCLFKRLHTSYSSRYTICGPCL